MSATNPDPAAPLEIRCKWDKFGFVARAPDHPELGLSAHCGGPHAAAANLVYKICGQYEPVNFVGLRHYTWQAKKSKEAA